MEDFEAEFFNTEEMKLRISVATMCELLRDPVYQKDAKDALFGAILDIQKAMGEMEEDHE